MENPYIIFQAGGLKFLVRMEYIETIEQAGVTRTKTVPVFDFVRITGLTESVGSVRYTLIFRAGEERFGIMADLVEDITAVREEAIVSLGNLILGEKNGYLAGAVHLEAMEPPVLYTIDIGGLYEKVVLCEPDYWY